MWREGHNSELLIIIIIIGIVIIKWQQPMCTESFPVYVHIFVSPQNPVILGGGLSSYGLPFTSKETKAEMLCRPARDHTAGRCQPGLQSRLPAPPSALSVTPGCSGEPGCRAGLKVAGRAGQAETLTSGPKRAQGFHFNSPTPNPLTQGNICSLFGKKKQTHKHKSTEIITAHPEVSILNI